MSGAERFLARVVRALDDASVPYMLAGSFASSHHGAPRATQDIDIVVDPTFDSLDQFVTAMKGDDADVFEPLDQNAGGMPLGCSRRCGSSLSRD